jgi:hypothetical protein
VTINLTIDNDPSDDKPGLVLETTPEHPFYVNGTWVDAEDLSVGTVLTSLNDDKEIIPLGTITSTERIEQEKVMYNLTVDEAHTFFVGEGEWLVHNQNLFCKTILGSHIKYGTIHTRPDGSISNVTGIHDFNSISSLDPRLTVELPANYDPNKSIKAVVRWNGGYKETTLFPSSWTDDDIGAAMQNLVMSRRAVQGSDLKEAFYKGVTVRGRVVNGEVVQFFPR